MSSPTPIAPEIRAKILSAVKDDGLSFAEVGRMYNISDDSVRRLVRGTLDNGHTSSSEFVRLKRENQQLKEIIGSLLLDRELTKKNLTRP
jgi:hypothetical protein